MGHILRFCKAFLDLCIAVNSGHSHWDGGTHTWASSTKARTVGLPTFYLFILLAYYLGLSFKSKNVSSSSFYLYLWYGFSVGLAADKSIFQLWILKFFFNTTFFLDAVVCASCSSAPGDLNCFRVCFPLSRHCKNMHILSFPFPPPNMHTLSSKKAYSSQGSSYNMTFVGVSKITSEGE